MSLNGGVASNYIINRMELFEIYMEYLAESKKIQVTLTNDPSNKNQTAPILIHCR
jgi:hypothetical protein